MRGIVTAVLCGLAVLLAAGCGGDGQGASPTLVVTSTIPARTTPAPAERSGYAAALAALCVERRASLEAIGNPTSPDELTQLMPKQIVVLKRFSQQSKKLQPSSGQARAKRSFDRYYATYVDGQIYALKTLQGGAFDGYFRVADSSLVWQRQAEKTAVSIGARECAKRPFEDQAPS